MAQYLKPDSALGYIEDTADIECLKFNNLRHIILGCMLGDFDENGAYVVSPEIIEELISMEKYIVNTYDNIELCKSVLKLDKQITFMVTFEGNKATLSLVEKLNYEANYAINSGTYSNINEYVLNVVETSGEINRNVLYERWNIKTTQGRIIDIFSADESVLAKYMGIVSRFKYLLEANKTMLQKEEEMEEVEASYANNILDILTRYPQLNDVVIKTIHESLSEKKNAITIKKPYFAKTFNEVLENAIAQNLNVLQEKDLNEFEKEKRNATVNFNIKRENLVELEHVNKNDSKQISPDVLKLKIPMTYNIKSVQEIAEDYVAENRRVTKLYGEQEQTENSDLISRVIARNSEREKLITTIVGLGVGALVGGPAGAVVGATVAAATAEVVSAVKEETKKTAPAKKPEIKKSEVKKSTPAKKPEVKKPEVKKPEVKKDKSAKTDKVEGTKEEFKSKKKKVSVYDEEEEEESLYYGSTSGVVTEPPHNTKGRTVKQSILEKLNQARAGLDVEQAKRIETTTGNSTFSAQTEKERSKTELAKNKEEEGLKNQNSTRVNSENINSI